MRDMPDNSIDAVVTDPPYGLAFMGAKWDSFSKPTGNQTVSERQTEGRRYADENKGSPRFGNSHGKRATRDEMVAFQERMTPIMAEALRVAKPGAHILCFGGTRTFHRMACAMEDAGWCIKDCIMYVYGSGYPKGQRVERLMERKHPDEAANWVGWSTQIKPAWEPIIVGYKPFKGTVADNISEYGTGAMNIDACRVPTISEGPGTTPPSSVGGRRNSMSGSMDRVDYDGSKGRFPANLIHDGSEEVRECFPDAKGQQGDLRGGIPKRKGVCYGDFPPTKEYAKRTELDESAARFFYCAKATKKDRGEFNDHPTCKPNALMRYLVRLVCREGGGSPRPVHGKWVNRRRLHAGGHGLHRLRA